MAHGVIFDMDGVLVASGPAHAASWRALATKHGIEISDEQFKRSFGQTSRDIIRIIWGDGVSDEDVRRYDEEKEAIYRALVTGRVPLAEGAREMLKVLQQAGYVLAVATSGPRENVELVLRETDLGPLFAAVVTGFDVKRGKPAPDCFLLAAERAALQPESCVVVEDAPVGVEAALAAGMQPIGFAGTHPAEKLKRSGATVVVERLSSITPELVAKLLATT
ncbi:MAG: HAD family hydrolase [Phycisphaerae bacterium]